MMHEDTGVNSDVIEYDDPGDLRLGASPTFWFSVGANRFDILIE